jgi:CelD/BcsL family acetyltransferase involved in cellulose biosynthesis
MPSHRVREISLEEWDRQTQALPGRTVFHGAPWLRAVRDAYRVRLRLFTAERDGQLEAALPVMLARRGPFLVSGSPLPGTSTPYLGPLFAESCDVGAALQSFLGDRRIGRYDYAMWRALDQQRAVFLGAHGFKAVRAFETYLLDLDRSERALWDGLKRSCRNRIRKARSSGLVISRENRPDFIEEIWPLALEVFGRSGIQPSFSLAFLRQMWANLGEAKQLMAWSARLDGRAVAYLLLPFDHHTLYYWAGGATSACEPLGPNNLLHWEAILGARERGFAAYDFISTRGGPGRFKATFGPRAAFVCTHWEHGRNPLARWGRHVYEALARARRRAAPDASPPGTEGEG